MVISKGVSLEQLEKGPQGGFDTTKGVFTKKKNSANRYLIWIGILFVIILLGVLGYIVSQLKGSGSGN